MPNKVESSLSSELLTLLRQERYVTLSTVDHETNSPSVSAISWLYALDQKTLRFCVESRSIILDNLKKNNQMVITFIGNGSTYAISGKGKILAEEIENMPIKLALIECSVEEVKDIMFYGAKMIHEPEFEKTYDAEAASKLDSQVMDAMKRASSG
ncbi:pyridoxamine 5'-phosphate oxidase family protein [Salibacterium aidingense]|uniref:pyridoxamine 5'-phosphate oxidase family protein n=1 Tax=Salibacterium aidingense TaxID=384933 RepID=UPI0004140B18|nr:pyridoxamine 5'-phosphate oxidase family protein [Salibacterium aidingense]